MIPFNRSIFLPESLEYVKDTIEASLIAGDGKYTKLCSAWMEERFHAKKVLMTTSCTDALEMCALLLDIKPGDEVIMPSYTFVSTANAFVVHGGIPVFIDIRPDTMNIDERLVEEAITKKTKAIVVVHYSGVACDMDTIMKISKKYNIPVVEDAAQGVMSTYKGQYLGTIGALGCYSFHETKNYTMGEGGALVINDERFIENAEIIREKGTDRSKFFRGAVDKYTWIDKGASYLPSEINVSYLYGQLQIADEINENRLVLWNFYYESLMAIDNDYITLPTVPEGCVHNGHMFYLKCRNLESRSKFISEMKRCEVSCVFHYVPLHSSAGGKKYGRFQGEDKYTTKESERLVRLPMFYGMSREDRDKVVYCVKNTLACL